MRKKGKTEEEGGGERYEEYMGTKKGKGKKETHSVG